MQLSNYSLLLLFGVGLTGTPSLAFQSGLGRRSPSTRRWTQPNGSGGTTTTTSTTEVKTEINAEVQVKDDTAASAASAAAVNDIAQQPIQAEEASSVPPELQPDEATLSRDEDFMRLAIALAEQE